SRIAVPRRERAAADNEGYAARNDPESLVHPYRLVLALRLFPARLRRHAAHLVPRVGYGFEAAILRMRATRLERHDERLAGGMHDRVRDLEAGLVDPIEDLEADADPRFGAGLAPARFRGLDGGHQPVDVGLGVGDTEAHPVGRLLAADLADRRRLRQRKAPVQHRVVLRLAGFGGALAVDLRTRRLGKRRPVTATADRFDGAVKRRAVTLEKGIRHGRDLRRFCSDYSSTQRMRRSRSTLSSRCRSGRSRR